MAQTTTAFNACDARIKIDDDEGAPVDVSGSTNSASLSLESDIGEYKSFSSAGWKGRLACGRDASLDVTVIGSTDTDEALALVRQWYASDHTTPRTITIDAPDSSVGSERWAGEFLIETVDFDLEADDPDAVEFDASFLPNGAVTWAVIAS